MRRFFGKIEKNNAIIEGEEFVHLKTVLRSKVGENIVVYIGDENEYICQISSMNKSSAICEIVEKNKCSGLPIKNIVLYQALVKRDKMELILQKAVEIGIKKLVPFESEFCTVKPNENRRDRLEKLVFTACKQCERSLPMEIADSIRFEDLIKDLKEFSKKQNSIILFANEREGDEFDFSSLKNKENIAIIVGPEGGFSGREKESLVKLCESVTLGKRILRAETASIVLCGMVSIMGGN